MYFVVCLALGPLLWLALARPPRAREGALLAGAIPLLLVLAGVAWQNKQPELLAAGRVNVNAVGAEALARAVDVRPSLAEAVVRWRDERAGGHFRSLGRIPSLGQANRRDRARIAALAAAKADPQRRREALAQLRAIRDSGRVGNEAPKGDRGLYPDRHRQWLAAVALDPRLSLDRSPRARLLAVLRDPAVVDRVIQFRYLLPNRRFDLPDVLAVPSQQIVLRDSAVIGRWLRWAVGLPLGLLLGLHLLLRQRAPNWDPLLLPLFTTLGGLGVVVLFAISRPLLDPALPFFSSLLLLPEFMRQGMALALALASLAGWLLLPAGWRRALGDGLRQAAEHFWLWGGLAFCLLAANLAAGIIGRLGVSGWALVLSVPALGALAYWRKRMPPPAVVLLAAGLIFLLIGVRVQARSFAVLYIESAKLALAAFLAAFAATHDALLPDHFHHIPTRSLRAALFWFAGCCALVLATGDLGFLLLLWLPACVLGTMMLRRPGPLLFGLGSLVAAGITLYLTAPLLQHVLGWEVPFRDRWRMFRDPWHGVSDQIANALYRIASVPSAVVGPGLGRGTHPETTADVRDVIFPFHFENLGAVGLVVVLGLFLLLLYRMSAVGLEAREAFPRWFVLGSTAVLAVQTAYAFAASANLLPLTGITAAPLASGAAGVLGMGVMVGVACATAGGERRRPPRSLARAIGWVYLCAGTLLAVTAGAYAHLALFRGDRVALMAYRGPDGATPRDNPRLAEAWGDLPAAEILCRRSSTAWETANLLPVAWSPKGVAGRRYQPGELGEALLPASGLRTPTGWAEGNEAYWADLLVGVHSESLTVLDPGVRRRRVKKGLLAHWRETHRPFLRPPTREAPEAQRLTLIADLQLSAYRRLKQYLEDVDRQRPLADGRARRGVIAICDPRTGEYLAVAQVPSFAPNAALADWRQLDALLRRSPYALADNLRGTLRAPGSVAKINTIAALLQAKPHLSRRTYRCAPGVVPGISCMGGANHGWVTPARILAVSCNRGAAQAAHDAGWVNLMEAYQRQKYRFAEAERARYGILRPPSAAAAGEPPQDRGPAADFRDYTRFIAFGQVLGASVDEVMRSACALANRGRLVSPHWRTAAPVWEAAVWRPEVADTLSWYLLGAAGRGGTAATVWGNGPRYPSKTGSAQTGTTESDAWFVTYGPWAPAAGQRPRVVIVAWAERVGTKGRLQEGTGSDMARQLGIPALMAEALARTAE